MAAKKKPRVSRARPHSLHITLNDEELDKLKQMAEEIGVSVSDVIREATFYPRRGPWRMA